MKILITGGNGNIAKMIYEHFKNIHEICNPNHSQLDLLDLSQIKDFLKNKKFDILIHTAINGGRRTKKETADVIYNNLLMWENILFVKEHFKMIIQFDSGAIYDRGTDIMNKLENDLTSVPNDYYGLSKYIIYNRGLSYYNIFNIRLFNVFHENEEPDRFIKKCFLAKKNNDKLVIFEDKYFDFVYKDDFLKIIKYYLDNLENIEKNPKTLNICYDKKYKLSEIAELILGTKDNIIINHKSDNNYCGNGDLLNSLNLNLDGLVKSLDKYKLNYFTR